MLDEFEKACHIINCRLFTVYDILDQVYKNIRTHTQSINSRGNGRQNDKSTENYHHFLNQVRECVLARVNKYEIRHRKNGYAPMYSALRLNDMWLAKNIGVGTCREYTHLSYLLLLKSEHITRQFSQIIPLLFNSAEGYNHTFLLLFPRQFHDRAFNTPSQTNLFLEQFRNNNISEFIRNVLRATSDWPQNLQPIIFDPFHKVISPIRQYREYSQWLHNYSSNPAKTMKINLPDLNGKLYSSSLASREIAQRFSVLEKCLGSDSRLKKQLSKVIKRFPRLLEHVNKSSLDTSIAHKKTRPIKQTPSALLFTKTQKKNNKKTIVKSREKTTLQRKVTINYVDLPEEKKGRKSPSCCSCRP